MSDMPITKAVAALYDVLAVHTGNMWPEDEKIIRTAIGVLSRYEVRERPR